MAQLLMPQLNVKLFPIAKLLIFISSTRDVCSIWWQEVRMQLNSMTSHFIETVKLTVMKNTDQTITYKRLVVDVVSFSLTLKNNRFIWFFFYLPYIIVHAVLITMKFSPVPNISVGTLKLKQIHHDRMYTITGLTRRTPPLVNLLLIFI